MRKCAILASIILFLPSMLVAQIGGARPAGSEKETRAIIFGGYSYLRNNSNGFGGWEGQGTLNFNRYLGVTADVSGTSVTPFGFSALGFSAGTYQRLNNYLFGPTITASLGKSSVFAHALFGEAHSSLGAGVGIPIIGGISTGITSANAFAMAFGGGIDVGLTRHLAIRAVQVDYLRTQFNATDALTTGLSSSLGNRQSSFRYSSGVVFRF
jgi:peptidoglycan-associated lipoprotein